MFEHLTAQEAASLTLIVTVFIFITVFSTVLMVCMIMNRNSEIRELKAEIEELSPTHNS